jgi:hypothetical protein
MAVDVTVLDYYGQVTSEGSSSQRTNQALVQAKSPFITAQTEQTSSNGTAAFTGLRLRAQAGLYFISFNATTTVRTLQAAEVGEGRDGTVYCALWARGALMRQRPDL